jgi:hypothetical protein
VICVIDEKRKCRNNQSLVGIFNIGCGGKSRVDVLGERGSVLCELQQVRDAFQRQLLDALIAWAELRHCDMARLSIQSI